MFRLLLGLMIAAGIVYCGEKAETPGAAPQAEKTSEQKDTPLKTGNEQKAAPKQSEKKEDEKKADPAEDTTAVKKEEPEKKTPAASVEVVKKGKSVKTSVTLNSDEQTIESLVETIRKASGLNMVLDSRAIQKGIEDGTVRRTITLKADGMTLRSALNWICRLAGLAWTLQDEAIFISTPDNIKSQGKRMRIYDVRDLNVQPPDFPGPNIELVPGEADVNFNL